MNIIQPGLIDRFPAFFSQVAFDGSTPMWRTTTVDPVTLIYILLGIAILVSAVIAFIYFYQNRMRYKVFENEMKSLDLDTESEGTLAAMVKRYAMDEPVQILFSPRLFDEMATSEIVRVLASPGSAKAKQNFIDTVYTIRTKTYFPERCKESKSDNGDHVSVKMQGTNGSIVYTQ